MGGGCKKDSNLFQESTGFSFCNIIPLESVSIPWHLMTPESVVDSESCFGDGKNEPIVI